MTDETTPMTTDVLALREALAKWSEHYLTSDAADAFQQMDDEAIASLIAAVRAETLAGPGVVEALPETKALHDFLWDEMEWFSDDTGPMHRYTTMAHGQKHDDLVERFHDAYIRALAATPPTGLTRDEAITAMADMTRRYTDLRRAGLEMFPDADMLVEGDRITMDRARVEAFSIALATPAPEVEP